eukprot:6198038-Prymnesium_polylepis.1
MSNGVDNSHIPKMQEPICEEYGTPVRGCVVSGTWKLYGLIAVCAPVITRVVSVDSTGVDLGSLEGFETKSLQCGAGLLVCAP